MGKGNPVLFSVDVPKAPSSVRSIAAAFGCTVWSPKEGIRVSDKSEIASEFSIDDLHQRDALAAAVMAYRSISSLIDKARQKSPENWEDVVDLVLRREVPNISEAVSLLMPEERNGKVYVKVPVMTRRILQLHMKIDRLEREISLLRKREAEMKQTIRELKQEISRISRPVKRTVVRIEVPEERGLVEVVRLEDYSRKSLFGVDICDRIVYVERNQGSAKLLRSLKPFVVICEGDIEGVPTISKKEVNLIEKMGKMYMTEEDVESLRKNPGLLVKRVFG